MTARSSAAPRPGGARWQAAAPAPRGLCIADMVASACIDWNRNAAWMAISILSLDNIGDHGDHDGHSGHDDQNLCSRKNGPRSPRAGV